MRQRLVVTNDRVKPARATVTLAYWLAARVLVSTNAIRNMDRNWDQDHFNTRDLDKVVVRIHVCAYVNESNAGDEEGNPPTNHWAIFLELADQNSVRLDMAPGYGSDGLRGKIEVASKRYQMTVNAIHSLSFDVTPGVTVRTITDIISSHKREVHIH
ncbi:hypothetical protein ISF_09945 [Cordyceps fumosorosea ARSEF 2679]|uniref:DUF7770 domain-containing protein n=1 Tax=Cordyceps fumosorosea (strain ARSEF 2679) TaxID=1081104 RepID=A0A166YA84_CORFA|nr:hypothetical protein ISF_09945 [Cordyceps fumosorosea ARSEF 2679]OAA36692.1 hypothetical protein ISF_09945 [Cordyceps fumosorosea ARSEF 2679]